MRLAWGCKRSLANRANASLNNTWVPWRNVILAKVDNQTIIHTVHCSQFDVAVDTQTIWAWEYAHCPSPAVPDHSMKDIHPSFFTFKAVSISVHVLQSQLLFVFVSTSELCPCPCPAISTFSQFCLISTLPYLACLDCCGNQPKLDH